MNTNKPEVTVTPDDGRGFNKIEVLRDADTLPCTVQGCDASANETWVAAYYAAERIAALEAECDQLREQNAALEAHVERQSDLINRFVAAMTSYEMDVESDSPPPRDHRAMMSDAKSALKDQPATSLSRIRAEAKAEALEDFRSEFELHCEVPDFILGCLEEYADEYRKKITGDLTNEIL